MGLQDRRRLSITGILTLAGWFALATSAVSCASPAGDGRGGTTTRLGSEPTGVWERSQASDDAYAAHAFTFRKTQPIGAKNDFEFYYKKCEAMSDRAHFTKTEYECTGP